MASYYDVLLIALPIPRSLGALLSLHPTISLHQGLAAGSLVSTLILFDALFRNPPAEPTPIGVAASTIVLLGWIAVVVLFVGG